MNTNKHLAASDRQSKRPYLQLKQWLNSLSNLFGEVTALEFNTIIVEEITTEQLLPWQVYQEIYSISRQQLQQTQIDLTLRDRYLELRRQLELAYILLLSDPNSDLDDSQPDRARQNLAIFSQSNSEWEHLPTLLPDPFTNATERTTDLVFNLLRNYDFLRTLRQLGTVKQALDRQNHALKQDYSPKFDRIYAQTKIQIDGKIFNRYSQNILTHPQQTQILKIHQNSIFWGEQQWYSLLKFFLKLIKFKPKN